MGLIQAERFRIWEPTFLYCKNSKIWWIAGTNEWYNFFFFSFLISVNKKWPAQLNVKFYCWNTFLDIFIFFLFCGKTTKFYKMKAQTCKPIFKKIRRWPDQLDGWFLQLAVRWWLAWFVTRETARRSSSTWKKLHSMRYKKRKKKELQKWEV